MLGLSVMILRECRVDRPFPDHTIRCWVRTKSPPPNSVGLSCLFKTCFLSLTLRHRNAVTWTCDQHAWFSLIYIYIDFTLTFCNYNLWSLAEALFFLNHDAFFGRLPFALLCFSIELLLALPFLLVNMS
jgi:hypothetical protein